MRDERDKLLRDREIREDVRILGASGHFDVAEAIYEKNREVFEATHE